MDQQRPDPVTLFYSYASQDEQLRERLETHLSVLQRQGSISGWHDGLIVPGTDRTQNVHDHLNAASIILLLISPDYLASGCLYNEVLQSALERNERGEAHVIPVILQPCDWEHPPIAHLQYLPRNRIPVTKWRNRDEAFLDIEHGIRQVLAQRTSSVHATSSTRNTASTSPSSEIVPTTYRGHTHFVFTVAWSPDNKSVASAGADETVRVWDATKLETIQTYSAHFGWFYPSIKLRPYIYTVAWSPNGRLIASAGTGAKMHVWNVSSGDTERVYHHPAPLFGFASIHALAWSPDGKYIASICSSDIANVLHKVVHIWDVAKDQEVLCYPISTGLNGVLAPTSALAWSPDGQYIASTCGGKTFHIWDTITRKQIMTRHVDAELVLAITWSPKSDQIAIATAGAKKNAVIVWNMARGEIVLTYEGYKKAVRTVAWSPDGTRIASGGHDETVHIWNPTSLATISPSRHHSSWVTSVAWSPDGTRIASGSQDTTVRVWQL